MNIRQLALAAAAAAILSPAVSNASPEATALNACARTYTFDLHAMNQRTGLPVARASCSADLRGSIIALASVPIHALTLDFQD
jgi:hypothetical protein